MIIELMRTNTRRFIVALPISPTPILKGKDAERFCKMAEENKNKSLSKEELIKDYEELKTFFSK